jgi:hypothetical protein
MPRLRNAVAPQRPRRSRFSDEDRPEPHGTEQAALFFRRNFFALAPSRRGSYAFAQAVRFYVAAGAEAWAVSLSMAALSPGCSERMIHMGSENPRMPRKAKHYRDISGL